MRLFLGFDLPLQMRSWLLQIRPAWEARDLRWVPLENWHLTLAFLGEVEEAHLPTLQQKLEDFFASQKAILLKANRLEWVPSPQKARLLWLRMESTQAYEDLIRKLHQLLHLPLTEPPLPHITLLRCSHATGRENLLLPPVEPKAFLLTVVYLYQSMLMPKGSRYSKLYRFPLRVE
ncbi:MAG: RNA 2',3'-cyclic phosphodiesterase [Bacteroidia bacterium]